LACDAEGVLPAGHERVDAFVVVTTEDTDALVLTAELRAAGVSADRAFGGRSMKAQMKAADRSGARVAVIVGADEAAAAEVTVRPLRGGDQQRVPRSDLVKHVKELLS
jgi:histidyl-tRNA synthetase